MGSAPSTSRAQSGVPHPPAPWTDEAGFRAALQLRVPEAWQEAIDRYERPLRRAAASLLRRGMDPENALGQTWLQAVRYAGSYDVELPPYSWLASICARICLKQRSRLAVGLAKLRLLGRREAVEPSPIRETGTAVQEALSHLSPSDRHVLTLRFLFGLSGTDVARLLDVDKTTLRQRVLRALKRLRSGRDGKKLAALLGPGDRSCDVAR